MHMKFTVNLAFWKIFKTRSPNSASNIQPHYTDEVQIFSVDLYEPQVKKLDQPVDLESFLETMGADGLRIPTFEEREVHNPGSCNCAIFVLYTVSIVLSLTSWV